jgi:hypothetical protein
MHNLSQVNRWTLYGGMRLLDTPCDVFQDNPLFSELIFDNPMNPGHAKGWGRYVRQTGQANCAFVPEQPGRPQDYDRLEQISQRRGRRSFDQLWGGWQAVEEADHLPWLVCEPRDEILQYWYGITLVTWQNLVTQALGTQPAVWRPKPDRRHRITNVTPRVIHCADQYRGIITAHSVSAIDAILAGRPAVVWGQDPTCGTGTPWSEWVTTGRVREPSLDQVHAAACTWAATTWRTLDTERAVECIMKS